MARPARKIVVRSKSTLRDSGRLVAFTGDWLLQAIGNEYRARVAYGTALQGELSDRGLSATAAGFRAPGDVCIPLPETAGVKCLGPGHAMPGTVTPSEFWDFYKDRCSEHTFSMLELSAGHPRPGAQGGADCERSGSTCSTGTRVSCPILETDPGVSRAAKVKVEFTTLTRGGASHQGSLAGSGRERLPWRLRPEA